jgi:hypothetical protein
MARFPIFVGRASRPLWHAVCHVRYFDQSLLLVEGSASSVACFSHGEKAKPRTGRLTVVAGPRARVVRRIGQPRVSANMPAAAIDVGTHFCERPLGIEGLSFNMLDWFQVQEDRKEKNTSRKIREGGLQEPLPQGNE